MANVRPSKQEIEDLAKKVKQDQAKASPAEKRVKIDTSFSRAVKKMAQTPPPNKKAR